MVKAIVEIDDEANHVINVLKAQYNLRDKSQAINLMAKEFKRFVRLEPEVRPEYAKELMKVHGGRRVKVGSVEDFKKRYGLK